jgi:hypothetical protein
MKYRINLFLTDAEREILMQIQDYLEEDDVDTMEVWDRNRSWADVLNKIVQGKDGHFPIILRKAE